MLHFHLHNNKVSFSVGTMMNHIFGHYQVRVLGIVGTSRILTVYCILKCTSIANPQGHFPQLGTPILYFCMCVICK